MDKQGDQPEDESFAVDKNHPQKSHAAPDDDFVAKLENRSSEAHHPLRVWEYLIQSIVEWCIYLNQTLVEQYQDKPVEVVGFCQTVVAVKHD